MKAKVYITLKSGVLDPQGQAVERALARLGFGDASDVRIGRFIELELAVAEGGTAADAAARVDAMCRALLANPVIEDYRIELAG